MAYEEMEIFRPFATVPNDGNRGVAVILQIKVNGGIVGQVES